MESGIIVGIVTRVAGSELKQYKVQKKAVGSWECSCSIGTASFPCLHKKLVWAGKNRKGVKIVERKALKKGWMPTA